jgi:ABC-type enterochelin transport system substrate-binding protein
MEQRRQQTYEERFLRAYGRWEKPLVKIVLCGFLLVILAQFALMFPSGRQLLSAVDRLEGQRATSATLATATKDQHAQLTIRSVDASTDLSKAWVKVNGIPVGQFANGNLTVTVRPKDVVTVDTTGLEGVFRFEVDHNDPQISYPVPGTLVEANEGKAAEVGPVYFGN